MTDHPIKLDGRRSAAVRHDAEMRRCPTNTEPDAMPSLQPHPEDLDYQMLAEPMQNWGDVMEKCRFLLDHYATTPEAADERIQKLIKRALGDMGRLVRRKDRK